jgi:predicted N-formylglutamate amidohydrolase
MALDHGEEILVGPFRIGSVHLQDARELGYDQAMHAPFAPFERIDGARDAGLLILVDHASNALPREYETLGLPKDELERHIGYDIGARAVGLGLARYFGAPALMTTFSRLLIDPNRGDDDPTLIMRLSDGAIVPGNAGVDAAERERRLARFWRPYHDAIRAEIDAMMAHGRVPVIFSMHSYTPIWRGVPRPWHCAVLWDNDARLPRHLIEGLGADPAITCGDNEPYDGALRNDTMFRHGTSRGLAHAIVEVRQDLIAEPAGVDEWVARLAEALGPALADPALRRVENHGSRTGPVVLD